MTDNLLTDVDPTLPRVDAEDESFEFFDGEDRQEGLFLPQVTPGPATIRFEEEDFSYGAIGQENEQLKYTAYIQTADIGAGRVLRSGHLSEIPLRFQKASSYRSVKMEEMKIPSDMERLYKALGLKDKYGAPTTKKERLLMIERIRAESGKGIARVTLGWTASIILGVDETTGKKIYEVYSTHPQIKRGEKPWPAREADGSLPQVITFSNGEQRAAQVRIMGFLSPQKKDS